MRRRHVLQVLFRVLSFLHVVYILSCSLLSLNSQCSLNFLCSQFSMFFTFSPVLCSLIHWSISTPCALCSPCSLHSLLFSALSLNSLFSLSLFSPCSVHSLLFSALSELPGPSRHPVLSVFHAVHALHSLQFSALSELPGPSRLPVLSVLHVLYILSCSLISLNSQCSLTSLCSQFSMFSTLGYSS